MGIVRYAVECPGCSAAIRLRLGVGHDERQPFFYVCPSCRAATRGALLWDGGPGTTLEISEGRQLESDDECVVTVTINPELPAFAAATSMAEPGGSAWLTWFGWLGSDLIDKYQTAFYRTRQAVKADWGTVSRLTTYYLNRDWKHFDDSILNLCPEEALGGPNAWKRDHQLHFIYDVFFAPLWTVHPHKYYLDLKVAFNGSWSQPSGNFDALVAFARSESRTDFFAGVQRDLFEHIGRYVGVVGGMFPGLLCDLLPDERQAAVDELRLFRDEYEILRDLYIQAFETCHKVLRWVVGGANAAASGDPNTFVPPSGINPRMAGRPPRDLDAFSRLASADKREWLKLMPEWDRHWDSIFDRQLRNDIGHASARHELSTGLILRDSNPPIAYTRFVQRVQRILHALMACANALKIVRIYSATDH